MDLNRGTAWGFMLRFLREDVPPSRLKAGTYQRPLYSVGHEKDFFTKTLLFSHPIFENKSSKQPALMT